MENLEQVWNEEIFAHQFGENLTLINRAMERGDLAHYKPEWEPETEEQARKHAQQTREAFLAVQWD